MANSKTRPSAFSSDLPFLFCLHAAQRGSQLLFYPERDKISDSKAHKNQK